MVLGVTLLVFVVMSFSPADPARLALGEAPQPEALAQYRAAMASTTRCSSATAASWSAWLHGDLGHDQRKHPGDECHGRRRLPDHAAADPHRLVIAVVFALILGVVAALYRDRWPDQVIRVVSRSPRWRPRPSGWRCC
jgi:peptide/nickel transport system permease protein